MTKFEMAREALAEYCGEEIYWNSRAYEAWGLGTMSEDDFHLVSEDTDILDDMIRDVISALGLNSSDFE